ncbi:hypothetical protein FHS59_000909 [Algoriphagus iocasae]|uniref:Uncharacterized protein n=1 Tax=Algoriphagus iocasae TaxID=1836499 RepID=A0A841MKE1_9BACT|nr:hypothetical protein [Algoriphagus iocasae]
MGGGAGFSLSGNHSLKDNRNLGKIRPIPVAKDSYSYQSKIHLVNLKTLDESIQFRIERKINQENFRKWIFRGIWIGGLILFLILYLIN